MAMFCNARCFSRVVSCRFMLKEIVSALDAVSLYATRLGSFLCMLFVMVRASVLNLKRPSACMFSGVDISCSVRYLLLSISVSMDTPRGPTISFPPLESYRVKLLMSIVPAILSGLLPRRSSSVQNESSLSAYLVPKPSLSICISFRSMVP